MEYLLNIITSKLMRKIAFTRSHNSVIRTENRFNIQIKTHYREE